MEEQFEKAARMRDSFLDLEKTLERQKVVYENTGKNEDIISFVYENGVLRYTVDKFTCHQMVVIDY